MRGELDFERLVTLYYGPLYRFALSLTGQESDAGDLVQDTFQVWARKGHQLEDAAKVKTWLFTTLHRLFMSTRRRQLRFPQHPLEELPEDLSCLEPDLANRVDARGVVDLLARVDPQYQAPVALFYLEDYTYQEIGDILQIPLGTVKSRIARGVAHLKRLVRETAAEGGNLEATDR